MLILLRLLQKLKHTLGSGCGRLQKIGNLRDLLDGLGKVSYILEEGLNIADLNASMNYKTPPSRATMT